MKSNKSSMLSRALSNSHIRNFLTVATALLARIVQRSMYEKIELEPADLLRQLTPGEPVIIAVSHTGRFVDVTSVLFHLLNRNWDGIQIVTWDGFVKDPEMRKLFRMLPLDNQLSRRGKTREQVKELVAKVRQQLQDIQKTLYSGKWVIIFPSEICGTGRHENPWKTGASSLANDFVAARGKNMKLVLLGINYESYTKPALSQILIRGEVLTITPDMDEKAIYRAMVEHEGQLMVWHQELFPTYEEALPFLIGNLGADKDGSKQKKWDRLLRYAPSEMVTEMKNSITTREIDETAANLQFNTLVEASKTRMTELEDILISLLGRNRSVYDRTLQAHHILEQQQDATSFDSLLLDYRRLCQNAEIPVGRDDASLDFKVLAAGPFLLPLGLLVHGIARIGLALVPQSKIASFYARENELQFRAQNHFFRSTAGWSLLHSSLGVVAALVAILIINLALAEELLIGLGLGILTSLTTTISAVFTYKFGWMFKLLWLRLTRSKALVQIRQCRAAIRATLLG